MPPFMMGAPFLAKSVTGGCDPGPDAPFLDIGDCVLWLRADLGITRVGGLVTKWEDQSGAGDPGRDFTPGGTDKPKWNACSLETAYNNKATIGTFNIQPADSNYTGATDCHLSSDIWDTTYEDPYSIFVIGHGKYGANRIFVEKLNADESATDFTVRTFGGSEPSDPNTTYVGAGPFGSFVTDYPLSVFLDHSAPNLLGAEIDGAASTFYCNSSTPGPVTLSSLPTYMHGNLGDYPLHIGNGNPSFNSALYAVERIAEVVAFSRKLTSGELSDLKDYFNGRYGMSIT